MDLILYSPLQEVRDQIYLHAKQNQVRRGQLLFMVGCNTCIISPYAFPLLTPPTGNLDSTVRNKRSMRIKICCSRLVCLQNVIHSIDLLTLFYIIFCVISHFLESSIEQEDGCSMMRKPCPVICQTSSFSLSTA